MWIFTHFDFLFPVARYQNLLGFGHFGHVRHIHGGGVVHREDDSFHPVGVAVARDVVLDDCGRFGGGGHLIPELVGVFFSYHISN